MLCAGSEKNDEAKLYIERAVEIFDNKIKANPENARFWYNKGIALRDLERYKEALEAFEKAIDINPSFTKAWIGKGIVYDRVKKTPESNGSLRKGSRYKPNIFRPYLSKSNSGHIPEKPQNTEPKKPLPEKFVQELTGMTAKINFFCYFLCLLTFIYADIFYKSI
ncbi:tetratricopeptide repeat protein [Methanosarcina horonobensis]|uniref:tetratricopeptide repeat protein n=1 Tax=Methanosarcina horonobensis TaxID=418008 RepID=UPI0022B8D459|nr:tetratricopeptide repeat protein [Methanosarcina horonobensis]